MNIMAATNRKSLRFGLLVGALVASGIFIHVWVAAGDAHVDRRPLREFPTQLNNWRQVGGEQRFDANVEGVLRADDYTARSYVGPDGKLVSLYVGYYSTQRAGATYHSPLNCLPGSGWTLSQDSYVTVQPANGAPAFTANRYIVQNDADRQLLVYWYQGRGRSVADEYWDKVYTVIDSTRRRRSDGAMVRLLLPIGTSEADTLRIATEFAGVVAPALPPFVPN